MADLVTRILLDDKQFNDNIQKSKQQLKSYTDFTKNLGGTFTKLAGGIGVAVTASEAFTKAVNSNKAVQDKFITITEGAKQTVNDFFSALTSGDWSVFDGGITGAIKKGQQYISTLKNLKTALSIGQYTADELEAERDKAEVKLTQKGLSKEERAKAFEDFNKYGQEYINKLQTTYSYSWEQLNLALRTKNVKFNSTEDVKKAYQQYLDPSTMQHAMLEQYKKDKAKLESLGTEIRGNMGDYTTYYRTPEAKAFKKEFDEKYEGKGYENLVRFQNLFTDENAEMFKSYIDNIVMFNQRLAEANKTLADGKVDYETTIKEETDNILKLQDEAKKKQYEDNKVSWNVEGWVNEELHGLHDSFIRKARGLDPVQITYELVPIDEENPDELPLPTENITNKEVTTLNDYADAIGNIANVMTALNTSTVEGAAGWFTWASSLMQSSAIAIEAIKKVIAAKTAEAAASGAAEAAKTPIVGWLMVGAAIASVLGAFASLPKFASGGIVGGGSYSGDNVLARVNSGEMILNDYQQANLFRMLNSNSTNSNSNVEFIIRGDKLVGVINNYNNKMKKII